MKAALPVALMTASFIAAASFAHAGSEEDGTISVFEAACLDNIDSPGRAAVMAMAAGLVEVPEPQRSVIMADKPGRAWISPKGGPRHFLKVGAEGACSIGAPYAKSSEVVALFEKYVRNRMLAQERIGTQRQLIYAVTQPDARGGPDKHAIIMIDFSLLETTEGVSLTSLPENVARKAGINIPPWP